MPEWAAWSTQIAVSADGQYIAATSKDEDIYLYYFSNKRLWYQKFDADFSALAMTPDAQHILACDTGGHLKMYDNTGNLVWSVPLTSKANSVDVSDDGKFSVAGTYGGLVIAYDENGIELWRKFYDAASGVKTVSMSSDGSFIAAARIAILPTCTMGRH